MIKNFHEYFLPEQQYYLKSIEYKLIEAKDLIQTSHIALTCNDQVSASIQPDSNMIDLVLTRSVSFEPDILFHASIAFGAKLKINPDKKGDLDWVNMDISNELMINGQFVTANLMARITLLFGEITSSFGQTPLILPPNLVTKKI